MVVGVQIAGLTDGGRNCRQTPQDLSLYPGLRQFRRRRHTATASTYAVFRKRAKAGKPAGKRDWQAGLSVSRNSVLFASCFIKIAQGNKAVFAVPFPKVGHGTVASQPQIPQCRQIWSISVLSFTTFTALLESHSVQHDRKSENGNALTTCFFMENQNSHSLWDSNAPKPKGSAGDSSRQTPCLWVESVL